MQFIVWLNYLLTFKYRPLRTFRVNEIITQRLRRSIVADIPTDT